MMLNRIVVNASRIVFANSMPLFEGVVITKRVNEYEGLMWLIAAKRDEGTPILNQLRDASTIREILEALERRFGVKLPPPEEAVEPLTGDVYIIPTTNGIWVALLI